MGVLSTQAVPAYRGALKAVQPDGTTVTFYMYGDENANGCVSVDGYRLLQDANGAYRYARLDDKQQLTYAGSPIAHDPKEREAKELRFVNELTPAKELKIANVSTMRGRKASSQAKIEMGTMSRFQVGNYPTKGEGRCLVLLVEFNDIKFSLSKDFHSRMLNEEGFSDNGATGSARDYYIAQSGGQFKPSFDVVGPVTLPRNESYYGQDDAILGQDVNAGKMIAEACQLAKEKYGTDFAQYDGDGDGKVDMVYVIYAGYGQNAGGGENTIWPHKYQLTSTNNQLTLDGKLIDTYACSAELFGNSGTVSSGIGTVCHEFGHVLGLCDHYDTGDATNYQFGRYDIMDYGSYNNDGNTPPAYTAFERMTLGWMTPKKLDQRSEGIALGHIATSNEAYIINTSNPDEFFLLENRQQEGWDKYIKGSGLMVTHVDFSEKAWINNSLNTAADHPRCFIVEADNEKGYDEVLKKSTEANDLYPYGSNDSFTDLTTPAATCYTGERLNKWVTGIKNNDGIVTFDFMANHLYAPDGLAVGRNDDNSYLLSWNSDSEADAYELTLNRLDYSSAQQYADKENFSLMTAGTPDAADNNRIDDALDKYMSTKGYTGSNVYQAGGWCQIGANGKGGSLSTPDFNFKRFGGEYAVAITLKAPDGKQPVLSVTSNGQTGKTRINSVCRTYLFQFKGGISKTGITIATNSERAIIDSMVICRGKGSELFPEAKVVSVSGEPAVTEGDVEDNDLVAVDTKVFGNITGNSLNVGNLEPDCFYSFAVKSHNAMGESPYSAEYRFNSSSVTGINAVNGITGNTKREIYTIDGKRLNGIGATGLYIIRTNGKTRKIFVKK